LPHGVFYGFPALDGRGLKAAEHSGGLPCPSAHDVPRAISTADCAPTERFVRDYLPTAGPRREAATCLYTMSRDEHFIVDCCPDDRRVAFAAGLSGHGFKFAPALGEALADLATCGASSLPIGFLGLAGRALGPGAPSSSA
jgi:glycine/D-amino acid oxidase-like deaminating enzyme